MLPPYTRLTWRVSIYSREKQGRQKDEKEETPAPTPPDAGSATSAATDATAGPSATGVSALAACLEADTTIGAVASTATQTRVAIWI